MKLVLGIDVGSTTAKCVVVDAATLRPIWQQYRRHYTKQAESVRDMVQEIETTFPHLGQSAPRVFLTGSGAAPLVEPLGAKFVQEVNAVVLAVEHLHRDAGSVVELGGQDAKIIHFKENVQTGQRHVSVSMNDKCASGTGATIDKCLIKVGMTPEEVSELPYDPSRLHPIAAKCGVFAETDIVNLVKAGIPSVEVMNSLADAIVTQNMSVLTRGRTLRHRVALLGGPNTYLPMLQQSWRRRILESWEERDYDYPREFSAEHLVFVPENSQFYAAHGAALYGLRESGEIGQYRGLAPLKNFIDLGRKSKLGEKAGPPLIQSLDELETFRERYGIPTFQPTRFTPGEAVRATLGLDGGSTSSKCVLLDEDGEIIAKEYTLSKGNPFDDMKVMFKALLERFQSARVSLDIIGLGVTGYAGDVMEEALRADVNVVETVAHMTSAVRFFGDVDVICDIGGQDIKVLFIENGLLKNFRLSNQCSAGNGMLLQAMADQLGIPIHTYAETAFQATLTPNFSYGCAVFLDTDRVNFQKEGYSCEEMLAGLAMVLPKNVWQYVVQVPRLAELGSKFVLQGGVQRNLAAVKAQVDYITTRVPEGEVFVHPHSAEAGAHGAAVEALRVVGRRGHSTFVGIEEALNLQYTARNDEGTACDFCPNNCSRTFIDTRTPAGRTARYISGFSCERGTVEDRDALRELNLARKKLARRFPNLVEYEANHTFRDHEDSRPLPAENEWINDVQVKRTLWGGVRRKSIRRRIQRSPADAARRRASARIGIPRVLNIWTTGIFWRTYFESLGVKLQNVVFSDETSEEMWQAGAKYGSVDPCFPAKVVQAHIHNLLFEHHKTRPLDFIFFPCITRMPSFVEAVLDTACCPIVSGTPMVIRAAFTKEKNYFEGLEYLDPAVTLNEPLLLKRTLFECFERRLLITEDENDDAVDQAFLAMQRFEKELQDRGRRVLDEAEDSGAVVVLMIGRPYHSDPGLNHRILEELQALGYAILSVRSIPKDPAWLGRFFADDLDRELIASPLEVNDVWPENYSVNSVQKVWAAKFAARHPNVAIVDLSSFKCGHDAPTYGIIDRIISTAGVPYLALHDLDANKPAGSLKIRLRTFDYALQRRREELLDRLAKNAELKRRLDAKRLSLLREIRRRAEQNGHRPGLPLEQEIQRLRSTAVVATSPEAASAAVALKS